MSDPTPVTLEDRVLITHVARRYFFDDQSKVQIAAALGISRFKVARLLDLARETGLVTVTITGEGPVDAELSARLQDRFGLTHSVVVSTTSGSEAHRRRELGTIAAELLSEIVGPDDVLGVGWARTVLEVAARLGDLAVDSVVQLSGAITLPDVPTGGVELVHSVARSTGATPYVYYAPMLVTDAASAEAITRQRDVVTARSQFARVTTAIVGVGAWQPPSSTLHDAMSAEDRAEAAHHDVAADLSGVLVDASGRAVDAPLTRRIIGIRAEELAAVPEVIGIAYGPAKVAATHAALRSGLLDSLVTDRELAELLLAREA